MSFLKPSPPEPPSPYATAGAQTGTNIGTAVANAHLNQVNQVTPQGDLTYSQTGNYQWQDPTNMATYNIPQFTATQTRSPAQQAIADRYERAQGNLSRMADNQSLRIEGLLSSPFDPSQGGPSAGNAQNIANVGQAQTSFGDAGEIQRSFGDAGEITRDYGPADNFSADRQRVEEALYGRLNPQLDRERGNIEQRLADQGIRYGSQAYTSAMDDYNRQSNDLRLGVTAAGGQEQARMVGMAAQRAAFQNSAQGQAYQQALGRGTFANDAQQQQYGQNLGRGQFANAGLAQQLAHQQSVFNASQAGRNQYLQEAYMQRNQPLNEINSLMSGSQVQQPNWLNTPASQIPTTDVAGLINRNYDQQSNNYNTQQQATNSLVGGAMGAVGNYFRSDKRVKKDIDRIGTVFSANVDDKPAPGSLIGEKLPVYEYSYKDDPAGTRHVGPMAQDVEKIDPKAVVHDRKGTKYLDRRRVMGSILRAG